MRLLVLGAAVSGRAAANLGRRLGYDVTVYDRHPEAVADLEGTTATGEWDAALLEDVDLVVTSPGIPEAASPIQDSLGRGHPLVSEMEFAVQNLEAPYGAVTGTNGKTTVTQAAADMLSASGVRAAAAGNIGLALSDLVGRELDAVVVEASSFQLRFIDTFHPRAAVITNIAPDHLDWHGDLDAYTAAKLRIAENQTSDDILAYDVDDPGARAAVNRVATTTLVPISGSQRPAHGNGPVDGEVIVGDHRFPMPAADAAFTLDLVAAATLAAHLGATAEGIGAVMAGFETGAHRRSVVGEWGGVTFVNDSKATNPHAAVAAATAYPSVILIAGGRNKGLDLSPLAAVESVRHVIGLGEAAAELAAVSSPHRYHDAKDLDAAVDIAIGLAQPGDTVLLAPGCASFDMFSSYADRGEQFAAIVIARKGETDG